MHTIMHVITCIIHVADVGGVLEVLPPSMITFAEPTVAALVESLSEAVSISRRIQPQELHDRVKLMYSWYRISCRTEVVYKEVMRLPRPSLALRIVRMSTAGPFCGLIFIAIIAGLRFLATICESLWPRGEIELCPDLPRVLAGGNKGHRRHRRSVSTSR